MMRNKYWTPSIFATAIALSFSMDSALGLSPSLRDSDAPQQDEELDATDAMSAVNTAGPDEIDSLPRQLDLASQASEAVKEDVINPLEERLTRIEDNITANDTAVTVNDGDIQSNRDAIAATDAGIATNDGRIDALNSDIDSLYNRADQVAGMVPEYGPTGPKGPTGDRGPRGPKGDNGKTITR